MNQALHILRKDLRRFWIDIAVSLVLLAIYCRYEIRSWKGIGAVAYDVASRFFLDSSILGGLVHFLIPVAWALLVVRVVQEESPVGDRQFWVTRPYRWFQLLAAKLLFVLICINLPLFIADLFLLGMAGFSPASYIGGLLWMQLLILLILVLPAAVLASVTATVFQVGLAFVLGVLYSIAASAIDATIPNSNSTLTSGFESLQLALLIVAMIAIILVQYARPRTAFSRLVIVGLGIVLIVISAVTPYRLLIDRNYPRLNGEQPPARFALLPPQQPSSQPVFSADTQLVPIVLHAAVSDVADDAAVQLNGVRVTVDLPDGTHWNSNWVSAHETLHPESREAQLSFNVSRSFYDRWRDANVNVHLTYAGSVYRENGRRDLTVPAGEFFLPGVGFCNAVSQLTCRTALKPPAYVLVRMRVDQSTCPWNQLQPEESAPGLVAWGDHHSDFNQPAEPGITPIVPVQLYVMQTSSSANVIRGICPGTPISISYPALVRRFQQTLDFPNLRLVDHVPSAFGSQNRVVVR